MRLKKKLLLICTTVVFGILTVAGISQQNIPQLSDVALANIEAIALGEGTLSGPSWTDVCGSYNPKTGERCEEWFTWCAGTDIEDQCTQILCPDHQK